jgi:acetyl-CoA carboxylase carboxyltransferase component
MHAVLNTFLDEGELDEFQADFAKEMICGTARIGGILVGVIANSRTMSKSKNGPRFGGIVYTESAEKTAYFIDNCDRHSTPLLFVRTSRLYGRCRGRAQRHHPCRRAVCRSDGDAQGAEDRAYGQPRFGRGYYAMAGQGFRSRLYFSLPTGRMGVMEGDSAPLPSTARRSKS